MPRRAARVDTNQAEIVAALRAIGAQVEHLHTLGKGCPDILVGYRGTNYLLEIKSPGGKLTDDERYWRELWRGQVAVVYSADEAIEVVTKSPLAGAD